MAATRRAHSRHETTPEARDLLPRTARAALMRGRPHRFLGANYGFGTTSD